MFNSVAPGTFAPTKGIQGRDAITSSAWAVVRRIILFTCIVVGVVVLPGQSRPSADQIPAGWTAEQVKPIGYSDLGGHGGAFKIAIREVNNRWYLYMGHIWEPGFVIVDVTEPTNPQYLKFIPQPQDKNTWALRLALVPKQRLALDVVHTAKPFGAADRPVDRRGGDPE